MWLFKQWRVFAFYGERHAIPHPSTHTFFVIVVRGYRHAKRSVRIYVSLPFRKEIRKVHLGVSRREDDKRIRIITPVPFGVMPIEVHAANG